MLQLYSSAIKYLLRPIHVRLLHWLNYTIWFNFESHDQNGYQQKRGRLVRRAQVGLFLGEICKHSASLHRVHPSVSFNWISCCCRCEQRGMKIVFKVFVRRYLSLEWPLTSGAISGRLNIILSRPIMQFIQSGNCDEKFKPRTIFFLTRFLQACSKTVTKNDFLNLKKECIRKY